MLTYPPSADHNAYALHDLLFFFKQKTAYEMRISDLSSDVCSSDLNRARELDMYTVVPDIDHALIRVALSGFWDTAVAKRYVGELSTAVTCVVDHHGSFNLFVEMTEVLPFSQDVATILGDAI